MQAARQAPAPALTQPTSNLPAGLMVWLLALLLGIQPVTTDLYLPALPALASSLGAPMAHAQLTLSALLLAFGGSQLVWGPLSDRFGRRPVLLCGLTAYTLASAAAASSAMAPTMALLIVWRVLQGAAMGAVVMSARAMVRDVYAPTEGARVMSRGLTGLGVLACISAPLGGLLSELYDWRAALGALAVFGAACWTLVALRFQETLRHKNLAALRPAVLLATWRGILKNPTFLAFSALSAASYGGLFTFLATSSFVFIGVLGLSKAQYGAVMFFNSLFYIAGTFLCRRLLPRWGVAKSVAVAAGFSLVGGTTMGVLVWCGVHTLWAILLPQLLFMVGHGIHQPCGQTGAVGPFPQAAGAASAVNGFLMMAVAFGVGSWLGQHMDGSVRPLAYGVWLSSVLIALTAWTLVQKYGEPERV